MLYIIESHKYSDYQIGGDLNKLLNKQVPAYTV